MVYPTLLYFALLYSALPVLLYAVSTLLYATLLCSSLLCSTLCFKNSVLYIASFSIKLPLIVFYIFYDIISYYIYAHIIISYLQWLPSILKPYLIAAPTCRRIAAVARGHQNLGIDRDRCGSRGAISGLQTLVILCISMHQSLFGGTKKFRATRKLNPKFQTARGLRILGLTLPKFNIWINDIEIHHPHFRFDRGPPWRNRSSCGNVSRCEHNNRLG